MNFFDNLARYSDRIAVITNERAEVSYAELLKLCGEFSSQLNTGALAFVLCSNQLSFLVSYLSLLQKKVVPFLLPENVDNKFLNRLIELYEPEYLVLPRLREVDIAEVERTYIFDDALLVERKNRVSRGKLHSSLSLLLSTSGSTGTPKLVRLSANNLNSNARAIAEYLSIQPTDRAITTMPMNYAYGLSILNSHLFAGASVILTNSSLAEAAFWQLLKKYQANNFGGVPFTYEILKRLRLENMELPSLKYLTQAGGRLDVEKINEIVCICRHKGWRFYTMYGQTEATARMSYLPWERIQEKVGSIGVSIPGGRFWLENEQGVRIQDSDSSQIGELIYEGPNVAMGYAECRADLSTGDEFKGILHTGDLARRDADGIYWIAGRKSRFLKIFGNRIQLDEVERLIGALGIECVCTGKDDQVEVYITTKGAEDQVLLYLSSQMKLHRSAFQVFYISEIPRQSSGKIMYAHLASMFEEMKKGGNRV